MMIPGNEITMANPWWLLLLSLLPFLLWYYIKKHHTSGSIRMSTASWAFGKDMRSPRQRLMHLPFVLRMLALTLLIVAMARPQTGDSSKKINIEGIDIMLALDVSGSMKAMDLKPNRLEAAKKVAKTFIDGRPNDRIGLVVFSGEAFTQCPLTVDHVVLKNLIDPVKSGMIEDGTAIGDGLATAINRIKESKAISKVIILLTDGVQNSGSIDAASAAEIAKTFGIRIYTIGVGKEGMAPYPVPTPFGTQIQNIPVEIDEKLLKNIAQQTGGYYFRATSNESLRDIYNQIDRLEKSKIEVNVFKNRYDQYRWLTLAAGLLFLLEILLRLTLLRTKP